MENTSMTQEQKYTCIMCRAKFVDPGSKEQIEILRGWTKKGKAWAMVMLAAKYIEKKNHPMAFHLVQQTKKKVERVEVLRHATMLLLNHPLPRC